MSVTDKNKKIIYSLLIVSFTLLIYFKVYNYEFVFDDFAHIADNEVNIKKGLSTEGIKWAFTSKYAANWHPLTWLLYLFDYEVSQFKSGNYHITNVVFHILNSLLLFFLFLKLTSSVNKAFLVSILFAIHPLHIESVAWVSGRKDLLSTFFGFFCIYFYIDYAQKKHLLKYFAAFLFFVLSLMSKAMFVTMPFILLLLDFYPLRRKLSLKLISEKILFFLIIIPSSVITFIAQKESGAVSTLQSYSLILRTKNAFLAYLLYIKKTLLPFDLAVFYPFPNSIGLLQFLLSFMSIFVVSYYVFKNAKKKPVIFVSWFFFIGTLFPVIGIVKIGAQSMADRYSYVPLTGLFTLVIWEASYYFRNHKSILKVVSAGVICFFTVISMFQIRHWQNSMTLFEKTLSVSPKAYLMYNNLGISYMEKEEYEKAAEYFRKVLQIEKSDASTYYNFGLVLSEIKGQYKESEKNYLKAISLQKDYEKAWHNLGVLYTDGKEYQKAIDCFKKLTQIKPEDPANYHIIGVIYQKWGKKNSSLFYFKKALEVDPNYKPSQELIKIAMKEKYGWELN